MGVWTEEEEEEDEEEEEEEEVEPSVSDTCEGGR